jgi:hypothetical protein
LVDLRLLFGKDKPGRKNPNRRSLIQVEPESNMRKTIDPNKKSYRASLKINAEMEHKTKMNDDLIKIEGSESSLVK